MLFGSNAVLRLGVVADGKGFRSYVVNTFEDLASNDNEINIADIITQIVSINYYS